MPAEAVCVPTSAPALRVPVHFVVPEFALWPEIRAGRIDAIDDALLAERAVGSPNGWVSRTFFHLRQKGEQVTISSACRRDCVNVVSPRDFRRRARPTWAFILMPRADAHHSMLANFELRQNDATAPSTAAANIAYWPQAGLQRRDPARGTRLESISFKGRRINLGPEFRDEAFHAALGRLGITFEVDAFDGLLGANNWGDYRSTDAVLAVRNLTLRDALQKPASKLVNAWFGEVPAVLGPEPAYRALRQSELDYLEVRTPAEALQALARLKDKPDLYRRMVENGRHRREAFSTERMVERWIELLNGPVAARFHEWQRAGRLRHLAKWTTGMLLEPVMKRIYQRSIHHGPRLLDA